MGYEATRETIMAYTRGGQGSHGPARGKLADDAVFTLMSTGKSLEGRREVERFLDLLYVEAFRARDEVQTVVVEGEHAVVEALFVAEHIGTFDGIPATKREARVSYCSVYQVAEGAIVSGHIYLAFDALREQLTAAQ